MKNKLYEYVKYFSEGIGPRLTASDGERRAGNHIVSQLESLGYTPLIEKFKTPKSPYEIYQFVYLTGFLICISFLKFNFYLKLFLILSEIFLILFFYFEFIFIHTPLFKFFKRYDSKNIFVKIPAKESVKTRIIVTAHIDSATASILFLPKFVKYLAKQIQLSFLNFILLLLVSIISLYYSNIILNILLSIIGAINFIGFIITFHSEYIAKPTNGANDNASSIAILLGLAEHFSKKRFNNKEIWLVFTGAEEAGCIGIYEFLKKHKKKIDKDTYFIVLDCTGIGIPVFIRSEGMLKKYKSDQHLLNILEQSAKELDIKYQIQDLPVGYTEMEVIKNFGYKTIAIGAASENPNDIPKWHQIDDVIRYIQPYTLLNIFRLVSYTIEML